MKSVRYSVKSKKNGILVKFLCYFDDALKLSKLKYADGCSLYHSFSLILVLICPKSLRNSGS
jgi:hypothetical protein